jgi:hypothetical protein
MSYLKKKGGKRKASHEPSPTKRKKIKSVLSHKNKNVPKKQKKEDGGLSEDGNVHYKEKCYSKAQLLNM